MIGEIKRINNKSFVVQSTHFGRDPIIVSGQTVPVMYAQQKVTLIDARNINIESTSKVLDIFSEARNPLKYDESSSSKRLELCDN